MPSYRSNLLTGTVVVATLLLAVADASAQGAPPKAEAAIAAAKARVAETNARFARVAQEAATDSSRTGELSAAAADRLDALAAAMEEAPGAVIAAALAPETRAGLPPTVRALTEEHVDLVGNADVLYEIHRGFVKLRHGVETSSGRVALHFDGEPPSWQTGERVRVRGVRVRNAVAAAAGSTSTSGTQTLAAAVSGDQKTLMILVNFTDKATQPYTPAYARDVLLTTTNGFLRENSSGALSLSGDVTTWLTINMSSTLCDYSGLATLARNAAAAAGYSVSGYARYVYAFPDNACGWWGLGTVGGNPSSSWINGDLQLDVLGHEIGHNLGLYHSHSMDCGAAVIGGSCTTSEYGDSIDIMGGSKAHFNAFQKERLGWLSTAQLVTVNGGGTYTIEPYSAPTTGIKALKIPASLDASGRQTYYYVEFRQAIGYDSFMSSWTNVMNGVAIRLGTESSPSSSYLLDMTPSTNSWYDPALTVGQTFTDALSGVTISVQSANSAGALVSVVRGPGTCAPLAPTVTMTGPTGGLLAGSAASYTVRVTNRDSAACASSTFAVSGGVPANWVVELGQSSATVAPGSTASVVMNVTSPGSAAAGSYTVTAGVSDAVEALHTASASAGYVIVVPKTVVVGTDKDSYVRGETVLTTTQVRAGTAPVAGVTVSLQYVKADGRTAKASAVTNASGVAVHRLSLRKREPLGAYTVTVTVPEATAASAGFTVR